MEHLPWHRDIKISKNLCRYQSLLIENVYDKHSVSRCCLLCCNFKSLYNYSSVVIFWRQFWLLYIDELGFVVSNVRSIWRFYEKLMLVLFNLLVSWPKPFHPGQTFISRPPGQPDNGLANTSVNKVDENILGKRLSEPPKNKIYICRQVYCVTASFTQHLYRISGWLMWNKKEAQASIRRLSNNVFLITTIVYPVYSDNTMPP